MDRLKMLADETVWQKTYSGITYIISSVLVTDGFMGYLNENAKGLGVIIAAATFAMSWFYHQKKIKLDREKKDAKDA
jgi:hypothetical protein